jgi:protein-L-isoaspartate(D-aspartate) O-methyltransferase
MAADFRGYDRAFRPQTGNRVPDVGAGKGFLVKDFTKACSGVEAVGLDISEYAFMHADYPH